MNGMTPTETWYVLEDGNPVDPAEVVTRPDGRLEHPAGLVAMKGDVPRSRSIDPVAERERIEAARAAAEAAQAAADQAGAVPPTVAAEAKPEKPVAGYKTRKGAAV